MRGSHRCTLALAALTACADTESIDSALPPGVLRAPAEPGLAIATNSGDLQRHEALLDVPWIAQKPELPRGCEVTALAMLLRHAGIAADKLALAAEVDKVPYLQGTLHGNPNDGFVGDMYTFANPGYGVYHAPIRRLAARYAPELVVDLTSATFDVLLEQVAAGHPVWIIVNSRFQPLASSQFEHWHTLSGDVDITWFEHSVVIVGFDDTHVYLNDPLDAGNGKNKRVDRTALAAAWQQMGQQAITLAGPGGPVSGTCAAQQDGRLYCSNLAGAAMHVTTSRSSTVVDHLRTSYSYFECWTSGEPAPSGNTTWYRTVGDDNGVRAWLPAAVLGTTTAFDHDPSAHGFAHCP